MADAILDIPTGGGTDYAPSLLMDTLTTYTSSEVTSLRRNAFYYATNLVNVSLPECLSIQAETFSQCANLENINLPKCTTFNGIACVGYTTKLKTLVFPSITSAIASYGLRNNTGLLTLDLGKRFNMFATGNCLNGCSKIATLIIRKTSVATLSNINVFAGTPFASGKAGGTLYVPSALISSYMSATNWSTILGYSTNSIQAIEGSQYENYYADGTPVE